MAIDSRFGFENKFEVVWIHDDLGSRSDCVWNGRLRISRERSEDLDVDDGARGHRLCDAFRLWTLGKGSGTEDGGL